MTGSYITDNTKKSVVPKGWLMFAVSTILVIPVFLDLINGFLVYKMHMSSPILSLYRGTVLLVAVPMLLAIKDKRHVIWLLILITLFFIDVVAWSVFHTLALGTELALFLKMIYPFMTLGIVLLIIERKLLTLSDLIDLQLMYCVIAGISILISWITGVGIEYGGSTYSFGTKSFFSAQNDISLTLLIGFVFNGGKLLTTLKKRYFFSGILIFLALILLSTRSGILGAVGVSAIMVLIVTFSNKRQVKIPRYKKNFILVISATVMIAGLVSLIGVLQDYHYMVKKFESLSVEQPRELLARGALKRINKRPAPMNIFGEGSTSFMMKVGAELRSVRNVKDDGKTAEVDYLDLMGNYGILLTVFLFTFPFWVWMKCAMKILFERSVWSVINLMAISVFLGHSFLAGHAMMNPVVGNAIMLVYAYALTSGYNTKRNVESLAHDR